jgi:hypothetical protein
MTDDALIAATDVYRDVDQLHEADPKEVQAWIDGLTAFSKPVLPLIQESTPTHRLMTLYFASPVLGGGWRAVAETGVRTIKRGRTHSDLHIIQHGWVDYKAAHAFIKELLEGGVDAREIDHAVMEAERDRRFAAGMAVLAAMEDRA